MRLDPRTSLRTRLTLTFLLVALITAGLGGLSLSLMSTLRQNASDTMTQGSTPLEKVRAVQSDFWEAAAFQSRTGLNTLSDDQRAVTVESLADVKQRLATDLQAALDLPLSADARTQLESFATLNDDNNQSLAELDAALAAGDFATLEQLVSHLQELEPQMTAALDGAVTAQTAQAQALVDSSSATYRD
ncbi:MAG: MCP four helix bundle domain-containing protein, partial [Actinobacteria bacterium]|nr:MCP four helix bundle domain-containing protein [Actinomycetota bacterium]